MDFYNYEKNFDTAKCVLKRYSNAPDSGTVLNNTIRYIQAFHDFN